MRASVLLTAVLLALACTPERPSPRMAPPVDQLRGGRPPAAPKASPPDAGGASATTMDADAAKTTDAGTARTASLAIHDRLIAKLNAPDDFDEASLQQAIEAETGAKVAAIRRGALGLISITFAPTDPPRTEAEQRALVEQVRKLTTFKYVEPDRLMQAK